MQENPHESEQQIDLTGRTLGGYTILRRLGRGGMADVYLARQESLNRNVALKVLKPDLANDESYIERFQREAQSAAKLVQANIVGVYEVGEVDGLHFIAQEYVLGRNLREYLARHGALKPVMAINILRQVALAIQKADSQGVTHRDIKPENIMLSPSGEVKVADFGLARVHDSTDQNLTQIGITMGTPLYMSPEQVEGQNVDVRSDIYSLGITAYHMLAGQPPYDGDNALAIAVQHVNSRAADLKFIRPDVPSELIDLIEFMMAKQPDDRPQSAAELIKLLKAVKIEIDDDWDQLVETLAIESAATQANNLPESRLAVTRQLQSVMKGNFRSWWTQDSTIFGFAALIVIGATFGILFSRFFPVEDPFGDLSFANVPKKSTAKEQYEFARDYHAREPNFYQAVLDMHPLAESSDSNQTELFHNMALERLAEIYLIENQYESAIDIYQRFVTSLVDDRIKTVGHAGLAIAHSGTGNHELARKNMAEINSSNEHFLNMFLSQRLDVVRERYVLNFVTVTNRNQI